MRRHPAGPARTLLGRAVVMTLVAGLLCMAVAAGTAGADGLLGAVVGVGLVLAFLLVGQLPVAQAARGRRALGGALLLFLYTSRVVLLLVAFRVLSVAGAVDRDALGLTVVLCALAWTAGTVWSAVRWRPMVVEPEPAPLVTSEVPDPH
jgi:ATP synthase protein I